MTKKCGRPVKSENNLENRKKIIDTTTELIKNYGADNLTVRKVCEASDLSIGTFYHYFKDKDDLMMYFIRETFFNDSELTTDIHDTAGRITELYMQLIKKYMELGKSFMKSFYTTDNKSLSAYMCEYDGKFSPDTVMARSEIELNNALLMGIIKNGVDIHSVCQDICTIVKGCVFEWCLSSSDTEIEIMLNRIIKNYLSVYLSQPERTSL